MNARLFLATTKDGIVRAARSQEGEWSAETLLLREDVRCLAADPLNSNVIFAGTQANGVLRWYLSQRAERSILNPVGLGTTIPLETAFISESRITSVPTE